MSQVEQEAFFLLLDRAERIILPSFILYLDFDHLFDSSLISETFSLPVNSDSVSQRHPEG